MPAIHTCPRCGASIDASAIIRQATARAGRAKSPAKSAAARANGRKGGRPRNAEKCRKMQKAT